MSPDPKPMEPLVAVEDVHTYYGKSHILHGVSLHVDRGEVVGLLGRNGVGKSTTLKTIMGLVHPNRGKVLFAGKRVIGRPSNRTSPRLGWTRPATAFNVVLLPTPLRPRRPTTSPLPTASDTPSRMWLLP